MTEQELKLRTKKFALRVIKLFQAMPKTDVGRIVGKQLLRCGTSVGANYRAVCCARSTADFISKLGIVIEEADESCFWLEIIIEAEIMKQELVKDLLQEADEITAIMVASRNSASKDKSKI
jgi:four helix bundle protein